MGTKVRLNRYHLRSKDSEMIVLGGTIKKAIKRFMEKANIKDIDKVEVVSVTEFVI